jgi:phosphatidylglycerophosphate synthase
MYHRDEDIDRRPIATRHSAWAQRVTDGLVSLKATPNGISLAGMLFGVVAGFALAATSLPYLQANSIGLISLQQVAFFVAIIGIQLRLMANMFDGMVALQTNSSSAVGQLYNEIPDRVSDVAVLIGAGYGAGGSVHLGYWAAILAVFVAYVRAQGKVAGAQQEFCGPMAKQHRMFVITVASLLSMFVPNTLIRANAVLPECGALAIALTIILAGVLVTIVRRLQRISRTLQGSP